MRTLTYYVFICNLKNLVPFGLKELWRPLAVKRGYCDFKHKELLRPLAANRGYCDFEYVVTSGHNQLWQPPAARFRLLL